MRAHLSGSLETLIAELDASGMKLTGHARVEATPFAEVPLQRATLTFDHVNPQAFAPGAPLADLAVRAELQPVQRDAAGQAVPASAVDIASAVGASGVSAGVKATLNDAARSSESLKNKGAALAPLSSMASIRTADRAR
ncbi:hypothetical protein PTKU15_79920 [Paraburkholderia terrae]|nr:hypothetical protein PTKU15_79920 [Paraburkholderia terrae]